MKKREHALFRLSIICLGLPLIVGTVITFLTLTYFHYAR